MAGCDERGFYPEFQSSSGEMPEKTASGVQKTVSEDRVSEDSGLRGQKTGEFAALSRRGRWKNRALGVRGQRFERTEDR
ncbi:MAG: hypothetical protein LBD06_06180 [Candidatus Accumulibacter sp.]|jgi:hypothetical protein|nr:hypothetical protein [Accumulibacter sp.]